MTREDVIRITESVLENLSIEVREGSGTDERIIVLNYNDREISRDWFSVRQEDIGLR
jgi:hypothetical protein